MDPGHEASKRGDLMRNSPWMLRLRTAAETRHGKGNHEADNRRRKEKTC